MRSFLSTAFLALLLFCGSHCVCVCARVRVCKMCTTDLSHRGILPLQFVDDDWLASIRERHWWYTYRRYALNDVAPGILSDGNTRANGIRDVRAIDDLGRVKFLQDQLRELASVMFIPLHVLGHVVVPNCTHTQKTHIHSVIRRMISKSPMTAWEKQALQKAVCVVRSNPHTVQGLLIRSATRFDNALALPPCTCHRLQHLATHRPDGHVAVVPVTLYFSDGAVTRPKGTLPIVGHKARTAALKSIEGLGKQLRTSLTDCAHLLPESLFLEQGHKKRHLERQISDLIGSLYIRTVDKGAG